MTTQPPNPRSIFGRAVEIESVSEREAFLNKACAGLPELRHRVDKLLQAHHDAGGFLQSASPGSGETASYPSSPRVSTTVGPYKLLEKIGEGGMGDVWVADQLEPIQRRVALKLIKPGMDSRGVLARFEAERQMLALMDHPNIARVFDAGTTAEGHPYFVMELVKGTPITEFCDVRKLSPKERLELFVPVCHAIQHAHQKGIIHRDLKPSNVLVELYDDRAVPKVIDFGVAKAVGQRLTDKTLYTGFGALVGTPAYMAPEQATFNALDVDTRADVYALGVILYELLAGSPPIEKDRLSKAALDEVLRIIRDEEPMKPSQRLSTSQAKATIAATRRSEPVTLSQMLKGELDWIVMKALDKDRTRRYETANGLAKDVQRYLSGDTVEACPPTLGYRLRKVYRRNRGAILTATAFVLLLACGLAATSYWLFQANSERQRAEGAERSVRDVTLQAQEASEALELVKSDIQRERVHLDGLKYSRALHFADTALQTNKFDVARRELDQASPEHRGWEWHYLNRQWRSDYLMELKPNCQVARSASYSPDGRFIVTTSTTLVNSEWIGSVQVWSATTGQLQFTLIDNVKDLRTATFNHDGQKIMTVEDDAVKMWNVATKAVEWQLAPEAGMRFFTAELSPDGKRLVVNHRAARSTSADWFLKRSVAVLDIATRQPLWPARRWENHSVSSPSFSKDGKWILFSISTRTRAPFDKEPSAGRPAYWEQTDAIILDAATGKTVFQMHTPTHSTTRLNTFLLNTSATRFITCDFEGRAVIWPVKQVGEELVRNGDPISLPGQAAEAVFSPDGTQLVTLSGLEKAIHLWEAERGIETRTLKGHSDSPWSLAYSPDGTRIISASTDGTVKIWDAQARKESLFPHDNIWYVSHSPKGDLLLTSNQTETKVWSTRTGKELCPPLKSRCLWHNAHPSFSPDGRWIAIIDNKTIRIHDTTSFAVRHTLTEAGEVNVVSFNHDGTQLLVASDNWTVKVWDIARGVVLDQIGQSSTARGYTNAAYSPTGEQFFVEHLGKDAYTLTGITLFDASTRKPRLKLEMETFVYEHWNGSFSADGKRFVGYFQFKDKPCECRVWNVATGKLELSFTTHKGQNCNLTVSPDGKRLITIGDQLSAKVWDLDTGLELLSIPVKYNVNSVSFHPDGLRFALAHAWGDVLVFDGTPLSDVKK